MARAKGVANFAVNFEPGGQAPLDARLQVEAKEDLYTAYSENNYYPKMIVTVNSENAQYILLDVAKVTTPEGWQRIDSELDARITENTNDIAQLRADFEGENQRLERRLGGGLSLADLKEGVTYPAMTVEFINLNKPFADRMTMANYIFSKDQILVFTGGNPNLPVEVTGTISVGLYDIKTRTQDPLRTYADGWVKTSLSLPELTIQTNINDVPDQYWNLKDTIVKFK